MARRASIPQRTRIFVGCEGQSEESYVRLLELLFEYQVRAHLDKHTLNPGAGDPLALLIRARQTIDQQQKIRAPYRHRVLILDRDRHGETRDRDQKFDEIIHEERWLVLWQAPCHEACLLRHLEGCAELRPPTCADANRQLLRQWPEYEKGLPARRLRDRIRAEGVAQVARNDEALRDFLRLAGIDLDARRED